MILSDYLDVKGHGKVALHITEGEKTIEVIVPGGTSGDSVYLGPDEIKDWINYYQHALALYEESLRIQGRAAQIK
jgi:hypothetical protein